MPLRVLLASTGALLIGVVAQASAVPYLLSDASEFTRGCYPPCKCPLLIASPFSGGFTLEEIDSNPLFVTYAVEAIVMEAQFAGDLVPITGGGTYVVGGEVALLQRMELDLVVGDEKIGTVAIYLARCHPSQRPSTARAPLRRAEDQSKCHPAAWVGARSAPLAGWPRAASRPLSLGVPPLGPFGQFVSVPPTPPPPRRAARSAQSRLSPLPHVGEP